MHGCEGSAAHKAAVTDDTVGDPSKDIAWPSLHVLIKLLSTMMVVCCGQLTLAPIPGLRLGRGGGGHFL